ncbi:hypothetical protein KDW91_40275, partial [Burkholderia cenocepacia]|nr:hypothetical protein [Burkholderia cenocepacia]
GVPAYLMSAASRDAHAEVQEIALDERETNTPRPNSNSPSRNSQTFSYVSATTPATSTAGGTGGIPGITTSQDQVGFKLMLYPSVTAHNSINLTVSIDQSTLQSLQTFTSGSGSNQQSVQLPNTSGEGATVDAIVRNGGTLILTGFEQKTNQFDRRGLAPNVPLIAGGSKTADSERVTTIIILSAAVQDADS